MNKKFCFKCNGSTLYEDEEPNVCSRCGQPFAGFTIAKMNNAIETPVRIKKASRKIEIEDEIEDEVEEDSVFEFEKPEIEITLPKRQTEKIADLATSRAPKERIDRPKIKSIKNKKQVEEMFKNEVIKNASQEILGNSE